MLYITILLQDAAAAYKDTTSLTLDDHTRT